MPVTAVKAVVPPGLADMDDVGSAGKAELQWERWVAGRPSDWEGRTACVVGGDELVLAGCTSKRLDAEPNQVFTYNLTDLSWHNHEMEGIGPVSAPQHVSLSINNTIFTFWHLYEGRSWRGLQSEPTAAKGKLVCSILQTAGPTMRWSIGDFAGAQPELAHGFSAVANEAGSHIILFGGEDALSQPTASVYTLDLAQGRYSLADRRPGSVSPIPRSGHSAVFIGANALRGGNPPGMLAWGGETAKGTFLNDMWFLDEEAGTWRQVPQRGVTPPGRRGHTLSRLGGYLLLHGGTGGASAVDLVAVFNLAAGRWLHNVSEIGDLPPPRYNAYAAPCLGGSAMVVFGGLNPGTDTPFFDVFGLRCEFSGGWDQPTVPHPDDEAFLTMSPNVQMLQLEREKERLERDNENLRTFRDGRQQEKLQRVLDGERKRWGGEQAAHRSDLLDDVVRLSREKEAALRERDELSREKETAVEELHESRIQREAELDLAEKEWKAEEARLRRRVDDELAERMREHEKEYEREKSELEEQAKRLDEEQTHMKNLWREQLEQVESQRLLLEERQQETERELREQEKRIHTERAEVQALHRDVDQRFTALERLQEEKTREIESEKAAIRDAKLEQDRFATLRAELDNEREVLELEKAEVAALRAALQSQQPAADGGEVAALRRELEGQARRHEEEMRRVHEEYARRLQAQPPTAFAPAEWQPREGVDARHRDDLRAELERQKLEIAQLRRSQAEMQAVLAGQSASGLGPDATFHQQQPQPPQRGRSPLGILDALSAGSATPPRLPAAQQPAAPLCSPANEQRRSPPPPTDAADREELNDLRRQLQMGFTGDHHLHGGNHGSPGGGGGELGHRGGGGDLLDSSAIGSASLIAHDAGVPPGCKAFLADTFAQCAGDGRMAFITLFQLLKVGRLMRGVVTVDLVLDIVHAAQAAVYPQDPCMPHALDVEVFSTIVIEVIHRLYGARGPGPSDLIDMTVVEHIIEGGLKHSWSPPTLSHALPSDPVLATACSLPVAEVLHAHKARLMQVFVKFSGSPAAAVSPYDFMSVPQLVACLETIRVIPHLITPADLENDVLPQVTDAPDELSPHEVTEVLCRLALTGFTDDAESAEKVDRLLSSPEFAAAASGGMAPAAVMAGSHADDQQHSAAHSVHSGSTSGGILRKASVGQAVSSKRPQGYSAKPAGVASPGSHPAHAGLRNVVMQPHEVRETLQQKQLLKVEMQRIFLYYSTLSNAGPPDGINPQKWFRLCHDTGCVATNRHYARGTPSHEWRPAANGLLPKADADAVFAEAAAETGAKATNNLNFDGFMVACRRLAKQMHPALAASPNDALHRLLCEHVLPKALRATEDLLLVDAHDEACEELFTKYRKGLTMLFNGYSPPGPGGRARVGEMQLPQFQRAMADFKIVPCLLSNAECNQVYHAARLDAGQPPLAHFQNCLVRAAHVAFSRHPYSANGNRPQQKLFDLLDRLSVPDPISLKHHLERLGMKVAPSSRSNTPPSVRPMTPKYPEVTLDDEEGLDRALKQIFAAYSTAGRMDLSKFVKLCVDTKVAHRIEFTRGQVEQTFHEASRDMFLSFDEWCDALLLLGQSRFPHDNQSDALRNLLSGYLLPLADRRLSVA